MQRSRYAILAKNMKVTQTSSFCSIHQENTSKSCLQLNLIIFTDFHSSTVNEDKLQNLSIWRFLLRSGSPILVKIWKWLKFLNSVPFFKKTQRNHVYNWIWSFWLTSQFYRRQSSKLVNLKISSKVHLCDFGQNLKMT